MKSMPWKLLCGGAAIWILVCLWPQQAWGIVVRDVPASHEVAPDSPFYMVGYLNTAGGTSATLISPDYIITAKHAVGSISGGTFTMYLPDGPSVFGLAEKFEHPSSDLAVVRLDRTTGLDGYRLYQDDQEAGQIGILAGYGVSGVDAPDPGSYPTGTLRVGYNHIDTAVSTYLVFDFDSVGWPNSLPEDQEVMTALGDSGGPLFIEVDGELRLAGVHLYLSDIDADGITPELGDRGYDLRISAVSEWIHDVNPQLPEPSTLGILTLGTLLLALRRRR